MLRLGLQGGAGLLKQRRHQARGVERACRLEDDPDFVAVGIEGRDIVAESLV
jgi:hypothetical protein